MNYTIAHVWFFAAMAAICMAIACVAFALARNPVAAEPRLGLRGLKRQKALRKGGLFASLEPAIRVVAGWVSVLELGSLRRKADHLLMVAGDYLGLSADELVASIALAALGGCSMGALLVSLLDLPPALIPVAAAVGAFLMLTEVREAADKRKRDVGRALPQAIELISLCMSAGIDFAGALAQILKNAPIEDDPLIEEFGLILYHLQLGHTRSRALQVFGGRIPTESVSDFVYAVVQAEAKGNPLRETLRVQASVLRTRRSMRAEELAAKAQTKMVLPMAMLLMCVLLLVAGPMMLNVVKGGL
jgi:tight adherence protein C